MGKCGVGLMTRIAEDVARMDQSLFVESCNVSG